MNAGEVTCVLGDNGAGKSTLIKIISGLHPHNEGTLQVDGQEQSLLAPRARRSPTASPPSTRTSPWSSLMEVWRNFFLGSEMTAVASSRSPG